VRLTFGKWRLFYWLASVFIAAASYSMSSGQTKQIAVTIDDLPLNGPNIGIVRLRPMTRSILAALNKNSIPAVGFANELLLYVPGETDVRIDLLREWMRGGIELGNHTFSHLRFENVSLEQYEDDTIRGEAVMRMLVKDKPNELRYFRHPFLKMGDTRDLEDAFESFLAKRGYRIAPVTIDSMDWMFLAAYSRAANDATRRTVAAQYVQFVDRQFEAAEKASGDMFGRQIRQILLLHANELNAAALGRVFADLRSRGYSFISLAEALADPAYVRPAKYTDTSDWLSVWANEKNYIRSRPQPPEWIQKEYSAAQGRH